MQLFEIISKMQLVEKKEFTKIDLAKMLGVSYQYLQRIKNDIPAQYIEGLELKRGYKLRENESNINTNNDGAFEIPYWEGYADFEFIKRTDIPSLWEDKNFILSLNKSCENIRLIRIFNKKMDGGAYPYRENDIAYIDLGDCDYTDGGIYVFSTEIEDKKHLFIGMLNPNIDGDVVISYKNSVLPPKIRTIEQLQNVKFKVIGRVFYNKTRTGQVVS